MNYRPDIDGLRAIAILLVVSYHCAHSPVSGGYIGVDIFFVISGFLITRILHTDLMSGSFSFRDFYARRIRRLFPALLFTFILLLLLAHFVYFPAELAQLSKDMLAGIFFVANYSQYLKGSYFEGRVPNAVHHLWSLGVEEQFYLFWPLFLFTLWRKGEQWILRGMLLLTLLSFSANILITEYSTELAFYAPITRLWQLSSGGLLSYFLLRQPREALRFRTHPNLLAVIGFVLIAYPALALDSDAHFPGWWSALPTLGTLLLIYAGNRSWLNVHVLSNRFMIGIGLVSYPWYLLHIPFLYFFDGLGFGQLLFRSEVKGTLVGVLSSLVLAVFCYRYVETPIRRSKQSLTVCSLLSLMFVLAAMNAGVLYSRGTTALLRQHFSDEEVLHDPMGETEQASGCFLRSPRSNKLFPEHCTARRSAPEQPLVALWGDSHVSRLYPAFQRYFKSTLSISHYANAGCVPYLRVEQKRYCRLANEDILLRLKAAPPDLLILHANNAFVDPLQFEESLRLLRRELDSPIVVLGTTVYWLPSFPSVLRLKAVQGSLEFPLGPQRPLYFNTQRRRDQEIQSLVQRAGLRYISLLNIFCTATLCRTEFGSDKQFVSSDHAHLMPAAADFLVKQLVQKIRILRKGTAPVLRQNHGEADKISSLHH